ncbi:MFS transporter [Desulfocurvus sp. DL9XJH121]
MHSRFTLAGLCLAVFLVMAGMGVAAVALPERYLGVSGSVGASGWLASAFAAAYLLGQYPAGRWADGCGYRPVLVLGCLLIAAAALVFGAAPTTTAIYAGRFVQGLGEAPVWALAPALLGRLYPSMRGRVMGLYNAAFHLGLMLGPLLGARVAARAGLDPFGVFAGLSLAAALLVFLAVRDAGHDAALPRHGRSAAVSSVALVRSLGDVLCAASLYGAVYGLLVSCLPVHLAAEEGFGQERLGAFLFAAYAGIGAAQLGGGVLSDRFGRGWFMAAGLAAAGLGLHGAVASAWPLAGAASMGLGLGLFAVSSMALVNELAPQGGQGRASGLYFMAWGGGYFAGPLAVGAVGLPLGARALAACVLLLSLVLARRAAGGR